jgi:thioredoxin reductase
LLDCAIVGGGPAGLNAALVLGLARRNVILFDNNNHRNAVNLMDLPSEMEQLLLNLDKLLIRK